MLDKPTYQYISTLRSLKELKYLFLYQTNLMNLSTFNKYSSHRFFACRDKLPEWIQTLVDNAPPADNYCTNGYLSNIDVVYPRRHVRNVHNKKNTCGVESGNADLRHYIHILRRRSRCFPRNSIQKSSFGGFRRCLQRIRYSKNEVHAKPRSETRKLPFSTVDV